MDFQQFVRDERTRINTEIDKLKKQKSDIDAKIAEWETELKAIDAYEKAKTGKSTGTGKRRTGIRQDVLDIISKHPSGIKRADILSAMNAIDKRAQQSVSNALANLKKAGVISGEDGTYKPDRQT